MALVDKRWCNSAHNKCGPQFLWQKVLRPSHHSEGGVLMAAMQSQPQSFGLLFLVLFNDPGPLSKAIDELKAIVDVIGLTEPKQVIGDAVAKCKVQSGKWRSL